MLPSEVRMIEDGFLHQAINKMTVVYAHLWMLHKDACGHINESGAIEVRDLCQDLIHKVDMWKMNKELAEKFKPEEVA